jgi:hypothetical protein
MKTNNVLLQLKTIISQAIDIHVHIGPEIIPRKYTVQDLLVDENEKITGCVLKNHFYPTAPLINSCNTKNLKCFGSVVLNSFIGGLNPEAIYASSLITQNKLVVWFPTISANNFLQQSTDEIAPEWVKKKGFLGRKAKEIRGIMIVKNNQLTSEALSVLFAIKKTESILATGHISYKESHLLIQRALQLGIKHIVVTHPIYQKIAMPIQMQKELAKKGCFMEQSYSMYSIDKIPIEQMCKQIREVGCFSVILSSDVGQRFSASPSEALYRFGTLLLEKGFTINELYTMLVNNPRKLLSLDNTNEKI